MSSQQHHQTDDFQEKDNLLCFDGKKKQGFIFCLKNTFFEKS